MDYTVKVEPSALLQLEEIVKYISDVLLVPETAKKWLDVMEEAISSLDVFPCRFALIDDEPWKSNGVRKMAIKGFMVYYVIEEEKKLISVIAVVYRRRDQITALKEIQD